MWKETFFGFSALAYVTSSHIKMRIAKEYAQNTSRKYFSMFSPLMLLIKSVLSFTGKSVGINTSENLYVALQTFSKW